MSSLYLPLYLLKIRVFSSHVLPGELMGNWGTWAQEYCAAKNLSAPPFPPHRLPTIDTSRTNMDDFFWKSSKGREGGIINPKTYGADVWCSKCI